MLGDRVCMIRVNLRLIDAREKCGYSQGKVAELLGVHRPTISYIESGKQQLTVKMLLKLCDLYGLYVNDVLHNGEETTVPGVYRFKH